MARPRRLSARIREESDGTLRVSFRGGLAVSIQPEQLDHSVLSAIIPRLRREAQKLANDNR